MNLRDEKARKRYNPSCTKNKHKEADKMTPEKRETPTEVKEVDELEQMIEEKLERVDYMRAIRKSRSRSARLMNEPGISTLTKRLNVARNI